MKYNPAIHHRRSIRLKGYDYTQPGAYFVTVVTYQRDEIFGAVVNGMINLSRLGQIVQEEWMRSAEIRKEIRLYEDEFVVMPNHLHGIVWLVDPVGADGVRPDSGVHPEISVRPDSCPRLVSDVHPYEGSRQYSKDSQRDPGACHAPLPDPALSVGADGVRPDSCVRPDIGDHMPGRGSPSASQQNPVACHAPLPKRLPRSLSSFIAGYKASVTGRAGRELSMTGIWQRNYYDHIIRSEKDLQAIWNYIDNNPLEWESDQLHPSALPNPFNQE
jgi:REP element-mobilizing transposase RayT